MRRRLLYHAKAINPDPTVTGYELGISEFSYPTAKHSDTTVSPVFRYYYIPKYSDGTEGERVYITQEDETPDFLYVEFTLNSKSDADVKEAGTELNDKTGVLTFNEWSDYINHLGGYRTVAIVDMHVGYAPNGYDRASADFPEVRAQQSSVSIYWHTPVVTLSYDDAPAQPEEEGGKIILKPTVKWTQEGYDDDGNTHKETSDDVTNAQYVFSSTGDITVDVDGNVTVPSSTVEERHNVGTVTVKVTNQQVIDGEEQAGSDTCNIYQEAYEEKEPTPTDGVFPMDILMLNNETHKQEILGREEHTYSDFPKEKYTPIGIILTPIAGDTGFSAGKQYSGYGNDIGVMGVIALTDASLSNSEVGTTNPSEIMCGNEWSYDDLTGLWCIPYVYTMLPYIDTNGTPTNDIQGDANLNWSIPDYNNNQISVATDKSDTKASPVDAWSGYANANGYKAASPYYVTEEYKDEVYNGKSDWDFEGYNEIAYDKYDTFNPNTDGISAFADYNGELNSLAILTRKSWTRGREWIENTTVNSNSSETDCPAVEACWKYAPEGTAQGGWYLPAIGELLLMAARFNKINDTLTLLNQYYGVSVSLLKDTNVPYLSSTSFHSSDVYDSSIDADVSSRLVFALFPNVNGDAGVNNICTTNITGATRYGGYVRPFKKIKNEIPSNARVNAYKFTPHYELMPAHYTKTLCDKDSDREWFGQKFIISFRRACIGYVNSTDFSGMNGSYLNIYGYKVKGENDTTKVDDSPRLLAVTYVQGFVSESLTLSTSDHWPQVPDGQGGYKYEGDEMGLNIVGRFSTKYEFDPEGAFNPNIDDYTDMDTDDFDRDGTVEPGWYVLAGIGVRAIPRSGDEQEIIISAGTYQTITKKEIDVVNDVESKETFFDTIRTSTLNSLTSERTDKPFYVGQFDRPVAILLGAETVSTSD